MEFGSDNTAPAAPEIMAALAAANAGHRPSYGEEAAMGRVAGRLRELFEAPDAHVGLLATGTAANALALACLCPPWGTVMCHRAAHVAIDECGAPEFFTGGAKLTTLDGGDAKIAPDALAAAIAALAVGDVHRAQPAVLSLTDVTERGAIYRPAEIAALAGMAHEAGMKVHLDGARFANALAALGCSPAELSWKAGVDALCLGGTKNGLMAAEAVILFDPELAWEFQLRRKRGGHLFSKHRFLSAQMEAYLEGDLWLRMAGHANAMAARLAGGLAAKGYPPAHPVEANIVFTAFPADLLTQLQGQGLQTSVWPAEPGTPAAARDDPLCRLVCSWATTEDEVDALIDAL
ncbi:MAG: low specificity L-threonine aldolase [Alphaproteobacteria bacterium]|nr:MAG: low specificity L-threonine aldolase [Alphaproteobacteria bacterium]